MNNFNSIKVKLGEFSRKFYTNELIKGSILFVTLGFLYLLFTLFIEYFLWLNTTARTILFWLFIITELFLLIRFIGFPIFKLLGLQKGITTEESAKIIGNHFPKVKDKLLNLLQLQQNTNQSDLLVASIAQKTKELQPIPFTKAVNFRANKKYLKYIFIPIIIWLITLFTGTNIGLSKSFKRVMNHEIAYTPPAPFSFLLNNPNLEVIQGKPLTIYIQTKGEVIPEEAKILFKNQQYYLQNEGNGLFSYTFPEVNKSTNFYIESNGIQSQNYQINVIKTPTIQNVSMQLVFPKYLKKTSETIRNTGNTTVPVGTKIYWNVKTSETDSITFLSNEKRINFNKKTPHSFSYSKRVLKNFDYQITSSNRRLKDYEQLQFSINVTKDEKPKISVKSNIDSISRAPAYFAGQISDDYGISKLELVYYDIKKPEKKFKKAISVNRESVQTFFYEFPDGITLTKGVDYELYFQVFDNDEVTGFKKAISRNFSFRKKTNNEIEEELLEEQKQAIEKLNTSLKNQQKNKQDLEKIQFDLQKKKNLSWNDQKKIKNIINRQEQYKKMMQRQAEKLQENLSEKQEDSDDLQEKKETLKKRIEELKKIEKQQKLLEELREMAEKLNKEELVKKAKELAQQNKQQEKSLERVLEMTKRFYVEQKMNQLSNKLQNLAKKQEDLIKKEPSKDAQNTIEKEFEEITNKLKEVRKENEKLKEPLKFPSTEELARDTKKELNNAKKNIEKQNPKESRKNQKKASKNMQEMSKKTQESMQEMSQEMNKENMDDLRKISENLIKFSFDQESLMKKFNGTTTSNPDFGKNLRKQQQLKSYFNHIDDSLFVLSMRIPKISSEINNHLASAHYNINQSLDNIANNKIRQGISNQQYVMTAANSLADMLSSVLDAMKNSKQGSGKGKGKKESFSLPDIIKKQSELLKKMQEKISKNEKQGTSKKENKETLNGDLYQIYKEQSQLRQQLKEAINKGNIGKKEGKKASQKMEELENAILEKGLTKENIKRMQQLKYELLKLEKASFEQGKNKERKSNTNTKDYKQKNVKKLEFKKRYYNQIEILNRQSLPLRQDYKKKVQEYFNTLDKIKNDSI